MDKIKKINEFKESDFESKKKLMKEKVESLLKDYDEFTLMVSPRNWRQTGHHFTELKNILEDIDKFTEITEEEKEKVKKMK